MQAEPDERLPRAGETRRRVLAAARRWVVRAFRPHVTGFLLGNLLLTIANVLTGGSWWAFWPLLVSGLILGVHFLCYKAASVDERWAEARTEELNLKSYDRSHIEGLKSRYGDPPDERPS